MVSQWKMLSDAEWSPLRLILQHFGSILRMDIGLIPMTPWRSSWIVALWSSKMVSRTICKDGAWNQHESKWAYESSMKSAWYRSQLSAEDAGEIKESKNPGAVSWSAMCMACWTNLEALDLLRSVSALDPGSCQGGVDLTLRNEMIERVGEPGLSQIWRRYIC